MTDSKKTRKRTIMMYSRSRGGKTTLIAELAEHVKTTLGKKTLVYSIDKGGIGPLIPLADIGVIDLIEPDGLNPWIFLDKAVKYQVRDSNGRWIPADLSQYGVVAHESATGYGDALMNDLADKASQGISIGGAANVNFAVTDGTESVKVGGSNMQHYGIVQSKVLDAIWKSQKANVPYIVWTAAASKDDDTNAGGKVIGPAVVGKALTADLPRQFDLTFRLDCLPAQMGKPERHILFLGNSVDVAAGNAVGLGNTRVPLHAPELPPQVEPASLVKALQLISEAETAAREILKKRLEGGTKTG